MLKPVVFLACLGPFFWLVWAGLTGNLSANPLSDLTNETGVWTLRFLCITLAITPLRRLSGWNGAIRFRRMAGLFAFFYGSLHFLTYLIVDRFAGLDFPNGIVAWTTVENLAKAVWDDVYKRPFITVGFTALASMVPLAVTSTAGMIRRLGGRRWLRYLRAAPRALSREASSRPAERHRHQQIPMWKILGETQHQHHRQGSAQPTPRQHDAP